MARPIFLLRGGSEYCTGNGLEGQEWTQKAARLVQVRDDGGGRGHTGAVEMESSEVEWRGL